MGMTPLDDFRAVTEDLEPNEAPPTLEERLVRELSDLLAVLLVLGVLLLGKDLWTLLQVYQSF
jgi:hypothetical protein